MAGPAPDAVAEQGIERRADGERQASVVGKVPKGEANDAVNAPSVQPPMKNSGRGADDSRLFCAGTKAERRLLEVVDRLGHPVKQQADAHASGKEHGEPSRVGILGFCIGPPEAHLAERRARYIQAKEQGEVGGNYEKPIEVNRQPLAGIFEHFRRGFPKDERPSDKGDDGDAGDCEYGRQIDI